MLLYTMTDYVSNCVYQLRKKQGITQEEFAKAAGVTRQTVIAIEKGNYTPSVLLALRISRLFKKTVEEVFQYNDEK